MITSSGLLLSSVSTSLHTVCWGRQISDYTILPPIDRTKEGCPKKLPFAHSFNFGQHINSDMPPPVDQFRIAVVPAIFFDSRVKIRRSFFKCNTNYVLVLHIFLRKKCILSRWQHIILSGYICIQLQDGNELQRFAVSLCLLSLTLDSLAVN